MYINTEILYWLVFVNAIRSGNSGLDNRGKEFVITFMRNKELNETPANKSIFIATNAYLGAQVNVTAPLFDSSWIEQVYVPFEGVAKVNVPGEIRATDTGVGSNGIYITSTEEVSVYGVNSDSNSTDGFVAIPIDNLGRNYMVMTYNEFPVFVIVAVEDSTFVSISTPSSWTGNFTLDGQLHMGSSSIFTFINRFQTLQITSDAGDLTGTRITCDPPVAVFSGSSHAAVSTAGTVTSDANHLVEQLIPEDIWGHQFVVFPTPERYFGNILRLVARQQTTYTINGTSYNLTFQSYRDHELSAGTYFWLETDGQVGVSAAVFSRSYADSSITTDSPSGGAPSMILLNPISLADIYYTFSTVDHTGGAFTSNYLLLVVHTSDQNSLVLDGNDLITSWDPVNGNSDYVGTYISNISPGNHTVYTKVRTRGFVAAVFGNSDGTSYGYQAGMRLTKINSACFNRPMTVGDTLDNDCDGQIDEELDNGIDDDGDGAIDEDLTVPDATDGNWGDWGSWGTCSLSCGAGPGTRSRSKPCDNPAPVLPGKYCEGTSTENEPCTPAIPDCPVDGNLGQWSSWSVCSVSCNGTGTTTRVRSCDDPAPAFGGSNCSGELSETQACTTGPCPVDGNWGSWAAWSSCPVSCGIGNETRVRSCDNPTPENNGSYCVGDDTETRTCNAGIHCPVDGNWGAWSAWSPCSVTCDVGSTVRVRSCDNPPPSYSGSNCTGNDTETQTCDTGVECPVDGNWGTWSVWNPCSVSCDVGSTVRVRSCDNPPPSNSGSNCTGNETETQTCDTGVGCPVDGNWSGWSDWSQCSVSCGIGETTRVRSCDNPPPSNYGSNCTGNDTETQTCDSGVNCPVDGNWGSWSAWSTCSVTCDIGSRTRVRSCDNPPPFYGGINCTGNIDGNWGSWSNWSACSTSCGVGNTTRVRSCDNPPPSTNGSHCVGDDAETQSCDTATPCAGDGNWGSWSVWSGCSVTCSVGNTTRVRSCDSPPPSYNGSYCVGVDTEIQTCDSGTPCSVDGNWGTWGPWSTCSVTCGNMSGSQSRVRACDDPPPSNNGSVCDGDGTEIKSCNTTELCPVNGIWGMWETWSTCSVTCGNDTGSQLRVRACDNPPPSNNGTECVGNTTDVKSCVANISCTVYGTWGPWGDWSNCSSTCGGDIGNTTRTRSCNTSMSGNETSGCLGEGSETTNCTGPNITCVPVNGSWSEWDSWSSCSETCGSGLSTRTRSCDQPAPANGGLPCDGMDTENKTCNITEYCLPSFHGNVMLYCVNNHTFGCQTEFMCIDLIFRCDGTPDCTDSSDESPTFTGCALALRSSADPVIDIKIPCVLLALLVYIFIKLVTMTFSNIY